MKPLLTLLCLLCAVGTPRESRAAAPAQPNIVFIPYFAYDLKTDLGEKSNIATANPGQSQAAHHQMMERLKAVGGYFPSPNPQADAKIKKYDPRNPAGQGSFGPGAPE